MLFGKEFEESCTDVADVTFETAFLKNWGSVKVTPDGSRSVRFREAKFFSRRVACTISAHSESKCFCSRKPSQS